MRYSKNKLTLTQIQLLSFLTKHVICQKYNFGSFRYTPDFVYLYHKSHSPAKLNFSTCFTSSSKVVVIFNILENKKF